MDIVDNDMIIMHHMWKHRNPTGEPESEESEEDEFEECARVEGVFLWQPAPVAVFARTGSALFVVHRSCLSCRDCHLISSQHLHR